MIWRYFGFNKDLFFITPLRPIKEDIELFVGRKDEIKKFLIDTLNGDRALKVTSGKIGVGKTTFVNACQYYSYVDQAPEGIDFSLLKVLPCFEKIQLLESDDLHSFINKALISLTWSIKAVAREDELTGEIKEIVDFFQSVKVSVGTESSSAGLQFAGFGLNLGSAGSSQTYTDLHNARNIIGRLIDFCKTKLNVEGVFVLVNNLDILSKRKIISLFNEARDILFDIQGIYWILIGREGLGSVIETEVDRVADYLSGTESKISPLGEDTLVEIVRVRTEHLKFNKGAVCPLSEVSMKSFHHMSLSELRSTFRICSEVTRRVISEKSSLKIIPNDDAFSAFMQYGLERAKALELTENNVRILSAVLKKTDCRPKDFKNFGYESSAGFISALQSLVKKQLLSAEEIGKARIYSPTGMTFIAGMTGALGTEIQKVAREMLEDSIAEKKVTTQKGKEQGQYQLQLNLSDDESNSI